MESKRMENQTKNIITREMIERELWFYNKATVKTLLVTCVPASLFMIPLSIILASVTLSDIYNIVAKIFFALFFCALGTFPIWLNLIVLRETLSQRKKLLRGEFDIVTRELLYKDEELVNRNIREYLHFSGFNGITVGHTTYQLASEGDTFYIVHYKASKNIQLLYPAKSYKLQ